MDAKLVAITAFALAGDGAGAARTITMGASGVGPIWTESRFYQGHRAFFTARALKIPTHRWIVYDDVYFDIDLPEGAKTIEQGRPSTSPL